MPAYIVRMMQDNELRSVPDDELLRRLAEILRQSRRVEADLVAHIAEVDARRLYARSASPSMFLYATEVLHLSEAEAYLRIAAARASREHPVLLAMLADGRLHLTAIAKIAPHLTAENREGLLARAAHKSKREIEELVAEVSPRPDVPAVMRRLPDRPGRDAVAHRLGAEGDNSPRELRLDVATPGDVRLESGVTAGAELRLDGVAPQAERPVGPCARPSLGQAPTPAVSPLAPGRYKVQFTASAALRDKLERLRGLMRSSVPDGDLAAIIEQAVSEKLERLEALRFARTSQAEEDGGGERHVTADAADPGRGEASGARARRRPMPLRGRAGETVRRSRPARVPPPAPVRLRRRPLRGQHRARVSPTQPPTGRDRLRATGDGGAPSLPADHRRAGSFAIAVEGRAVARPEGAAPVAPPRTARVATSSGEGHAHPRPGARRLTVHDRPGAPNGHTHGPRRPEPRHERRSEPRPARSPSPTPPHRLRRTTRIGPDRRQEELHQHQGAPYPHLSSALPPVVFRRWSSAGGLPPVVFRPPSARRPARCLPPVAFARGLPPVAFRPWPSARGLPPVVCRAPAGPAGRLLRPLVNSAAHALAAERPGRLVGERQQLVARCLPAGEYVLGRGRRALRMVQAAAVAQATRR